MSVMVTGIGFVGGYVVRDLLAAGEKVVLFGLFGGNGSSTDSPPDLKYLDDLLDGAPGSDEVVVVIGDIGDLPLILKTIEEHDVRSIIHLASLVSQAAEADIPKAIEVNVGGSLNIFEAAVARGVDRVVWASTIGVYGPRSPSPGGVIDDESPLDPLTVYGSCKAMIERLAQRYHERSGLNVVGLRLSRVYGFGEHVKAGRGSGSSWLQNLLEIPATGKSPAVVPFGERTIDLQYVEDVSAAFVKAVRQSGGAGETYLTSGDFRPVSEAFNFVQGLLPDAVMTLLDGPSAANLAAGATTNWAYDFDSSRAERELGIVREFSMEFGFQRTIQAYRKYAGLPEVADLAGAAKDL